MAALKSAICLVEEHRSHPRTSSALCKLFSYWLNLSDEDKLKVCSNDQRVLEVAQEELSSMGCPSAASDLPGWLESQRQALSENQAGHLGHVLEYVKTWLGVFTGG